MLKFFKVKGKLAAIPPQFEALWFLRRQIL